MPGRCSSALRRTCSSATAKGLMRRVRRPPTIMASTGTLRDRTIPMITKDDPSRGAGGVPQIVAGLDVEPEHEREWPQGDLDHPPDPPGKRRRFEDLDR